MSTADAMSHVALDFETHFRYSFQTNMNISELARRLNVSTHELRARLPEVGIDIGQRAIKIDDRLAQTVMEKLGQEFLRRKRAPTPTATPTSTPVLKKEVVKDLVLDARTTPRELASALGVPVVEVISVLLKNGFVATINEYIDFETASIVALEFGREATRAGNDASATDESKTAPAKDNAGKVQNGVPRAPVIVMMGHIDHGKTTLLDAVRKTKVAAGEAGGITQHIGAYQAKHRTALFTIIDTPGHEAFLSLRSRGAQVADIAILVVAADDGVKPQTIESLRIIERAGIPFVVALNKVDREAADIDLTKKQLSEAGVIPKEWGGTVRVVPISAKEGTGIDELFDAVIKTVNEAIGVPHARAEGSGAGVIIEAHLDRGEGPVATALVQEGSVNVRDTIVAGNASGKIRGMRDFAGKNVLRAGPSSPVQIFGLRGMPDVGTPFVAARGAKVEEISRGMQEGARKIARGVAFNPQEDAGKRLVLIVKADRIGALEAFTEGLLRMKEQGVQLSIAEEGLGDITDSDVMLAQKIGGRIYGFAVDVLQSAEKFAREQGVVIFSSPIIYKLFERIGEDVKAVRPKRIKREDVGRARVLKLFRRDGKEEIVGGKVIAGALTSSSHLLFEVVRNRKSLGVVGELLELRAGPSVIKDVQQGTECGFRVKIRTPLAANDELSLYREVEEKDEQHASSPGIHAA